ncbi:hypothetical protein NDU88_007094 [Pleurodeles waltl]|uniref:Uncharacterized protein n=1 Tax=Pleurodeles waltl TaxID=8319 RepID=A0AAV7UP51_PLEWA|nr:hypothetical protein NDU88_007094 [Pleurodeles waltl]
MESLPRRVLYWGPHLARSDIGQAHRVPGQRRERRPEVAEPPRVFWIMGPSQGGRERGELPHSTEGRSHPLARPGRSGIDEANVPDRRCYGDWKRQSST